ncbi:unnamed protein product [Blepharisma stoltei]|uniref:Tetratricopeptide repeat protein n=1 Tax=Blepharisma stoltei TaxID=1481888 RepID=A0AAU9K839_9CILI|nr:unnamed protein product [Blepharisma stoltei]
MKKGAKNQKPVNYYNYFLDLGDSCYAENKLEEAITDYRSAINLLKTSDKKDEVKLKSDLAIAYNKKAFAWYILGGNDHKAARELKKAVSLKPDYAEAFKNLGIVLQNFCDNDKATEAYDKAIELNPNDTAPHIAKGISFNACHELSKAIESFNEAIKIDPNDPNGYIYKAYALESLNKLSEAEDCINLAISLNPNYEDSYFYKALFLSLAGRNLEAAECINETFRCEINDPIFYIKRGQLLSDLKLEAEALKDFKSALNLFQEILSKENSHRIINKPHWGALWYLTINQLHLEFLEEIIGMQECFTELKKELERRKTDEQSLDEKIVEKYQAIKKQQPEILKFAIEKLRDSLYTPFCTSHIEDKLFSLKEDIIDFWLPQSRKEVRLELELKIKADIEGSRRLKKYCDALFERLNVAVNEAENRSYQRLENQPAVWQTIDLFFEDRVLDNIKVPFGARGGGLYHVLGNKQYFLGNLSPCAELRPYVIRKTAETLTIANREKIKAAKHNPEVQFWIENGLIAKYNDYFMLNLDDDLYKKKYQILGCLDALLIIIAAWGSFFTYKLTSEERINLLVSANSSFKFTEGKFIITDPKLQCPPKNKKEACCNIF